MRNGVLLVAFCVALAGCAGPSPADPDATPDPTRPPEPVEPSPATPEYRRVELLNETLAFPSLGQGTNGEASLELDDEARNVTAQVWVKAQCPMTTQDVAEVVVLTPLEEAPVALYPDQVAEACPFVTPTYKVVETLDLDPAAGTWTTRTSGECSCTARISIAADVPLR